MGWCENIGKEKKLFVFLLFGFFSSHSTFLTVATSEIWLFMAWNCTTAETSKLTEEGNGGSVPAKNTTSPASWQEDSAIPVQLVFPSPATLYIFRRSQEVYIQKFVSLQWTVPHGHHHNDMVSYALARMGESGQGGLLVKMWFQKLHLLSLLTEKKNRIYWLWGNVSSTCVFSQPHKASSYEGNGPKTLQIIEHKPLLTGTCQI